LARAYALLVERPEVQGHFNAVSETGVRVGEIAHTVARAFGHGGERIIRSAADVVCEHGAWALGPTLDQQMSAAKLRAAGWAPTFLDYRELDWASMMPVVGP
jgi:nucleoside-diphosphate-sugar epimerase